jgi:predicted DNA-binding transcriptional regulator AlpA
MEKKVESQTMKIPEVAKVLGFSRNCAYALARIDQLPVPVIRLGSKRLCVSRRAVERLLEKQTEEAGAKCD